MHTTIRPTATVEELQVDVFMSFIDFSWLTNHAQKTTLCIRKDSLEYNYVTCCCQSEVDEDSTYFSSKKQIVTAFLQTYITNWTALTLNSL